MSVIIYKPSKTAMQSGKARTKGWVLEHKQTSARKPDPLMGWISASETTNQVKLTFETKEEAMLTLSAIRWNTRFIYRVK